jgi:phosphatidylserine/phosphatidylglycerophosphate/cardiolipin synthase-like enzyme
MKKLLMCFMMIAMIGGGSSNAMADGFSMDSCSVHFSPKGGTISALVQYIGTAKKSIRLLAYNFTSADVANALIEAHNRGVDVQVVLDHSVPTEKNSMLGSIRAAKIPAFIDKTHKIAHNKVILVDDEWIETGSFNYTDNAEKFNGENALICHGKEAHDLYLADWERHKAHSVPAE